MAELRLDHAQQVTLVERLLREEMRRVLKEPLMREAEMLVDDIVNAALPSFKVHLERAMERMGEAMVHIKIEGRKNG